MTPPRSEGFVRMPDAEFGAILARAAEEGAKRALADVGLGAEIDMHEPRARIEAEEPDSTRRRLECNGVVV